jgi:nitrogen fixation protein FixH
MRKAIASLALPVMLILLAACRKQPPNTASASTQPAAVSSWKMALTTAPDPPVSDKDVILYLKLTDQSGQPIAGARVKAALVMSEMDMGKNEVELAAKGNGDYEGSGKFTMAGPWNIVITAAGPGRAGQQTFPVVVQRP